MLEGEVPEPVNKLLRYGTGSSSRALLERRLHGVDTTHLRLLDTCPFGSGIVAHGSVPT